MQTRTRHSVVALFAMLLALSGCMKSGEEATGLKSETSPGLDAGHGGARLVLPAIDPAALAKAGLDSSLPDTLAAAWFELRISGESMKEMFYRFPLTVQGGQSIEIKGIPADKGRKFHGSLFNGNGVLTHAGITLADIQGGMYADVRLYLAKASGSAGICVVIEGQKLPDCAVTDTLPPTDPWPVPDSAAIGGCWSIASSWIAGKAVFYPSPVDGYSGKLLRDSGAALHFTTWARQADTLAAILISPNGEKWLLRGVILGSNSVWSGNITVFTTGQSASFSAKTLPCSLVVDPGKVPTDSVPVPPKPDSGATGSIPLPGSDTALTTLCFEMRFDYGSNPRCETPGHAKMSFLDGAITHGNILLAEWPGIHFWSTRGQYDSSAIRFYGVTEKDSVGASDTLSLQGYLGAGATMAKGDYVRLPSGKKGNWTMNLVICGAWTPVYPDSSCSGAGK